MDLVQIKCNMAEGFSKGKKIEKKTHYAQGRFDLRTFCLLVEYANHYTMAAACWKRQNADYLKRAPSILVFVDKS